MNLKITTEIISRIIFVGACLCELFGGNSLPYFLIAIFLELSTKEGKGNPNE